MSSADIDLDALLAATGYAAVTDRVLGRKRYRVAVVAALCERLLRAQRPWMRPGEVDACQQAIDGAWAVAAGAKMDREGLQAARVAMDAHLEARQAAGVDDGHPAVSALLTISEGMRSVLDGRRQVVGSFFAAWERDVRMPAWGPWGQQFAAEGSTQALIPIGQVVDEFPRYALDYAEVRLEFEHLRCVLDTIDKLESSGALPNRHRVLGACPAPEPTWQHFYHVDRYPLAEPAR